MFNIKKYSINNFTLEPDSGGYEVRTDNFKNIDIHTCVTQLDDKIDNLYKYLSKHLLSTNDKKNKKKDLFYYRLC